MHLNRINSSCKRANRSFATDRLSQIKYTKSDGTVIDQIDYSYDAADQRISKTMLNGSSSPETPMSATFDAGNRMQTITLNPGKPEQKIYTLTYDKNGNLTKKQLSTDTNCTTDCTEYVWDSRNRLTQIKQNQTTSATYSYDAENRRIQTNITNNGATNQVSYIYAGSQSVGEVRNQQLSHSLMTGLQMDEHIARIALNQGATPQVKTYLTDALGSVIATAKADQSLEVGYAFSPYGQTQKVGVENQIAGSENSSQYTGRENDNNGLYFYRARYYDPVLKRFISEDPIGLAGGINSHAYVEGDPVSYIDPEGLWGVSAGGYYGVGGEFIFGRDPASRDLFFTLRLGFGLGGGAKWELDGGRPGAEKCQEGTDGWGGGMFADWFSGNFATLQVSAASNRGVNFFNDGSSRAYNDPIKFNWSLINAKKLGAKATIFNIGSEWTLFGPSGSTKKCDCP
jgi:RHS repeat-associated protein